MKADTRGEKTFIPESRTIKLSHYKAYIPLPSLRDALGLLIEALGLLVVDLGLRGGLVDLAIDLNQTLTFSYTTILYT